MSTELVSICIPTYNGAGFLSKTIKSCLAQTYHNIEILINDDCSTDDTLSIAHEFSLRDSRIKVSVNSCNLGLVGNWNETLSKAEGKWIKLLFQDDWMEPNCIYEMKAVADLYPDSVLLSARSYSFADGISEETKRYYQTEVKRIKPSESNKISIFNIRQITQQFVQNIGLNFIGEPSLTFFSKELYYKVGEFDDDFKQICDLEHLLRMASCSKVVYLPSRLVHFTVHANSTTANNSGSNTFRLRFFEVPVLIHKVLTHKSFGLMSGSMKVSDKIKLFFYSKLRAFQAELYSSQNPVNKPQYNELLNRFKFMKIQTWERVLLFPIAIMAKIKLK